MDLAGQPKPATGSSKELPYPWQERGYAMAVLLVAMSVMAVMMTVAMPVWKQMAQREKEEELVFRGKQYAHAIELMQRKLPGALPPNVDLLVDQKFLRKKYKDPITGEDFDTLTPAQTAISAPATSARPGETAVAGRGGAVAGRGGAAGQPPATGPAGRGAAVGGIIGVVSKSKAESIRIYNGRTHYNEWVFQAEQRTQTPGGGGAPAGGPGRGAAGPQPGGGRGGPAGGRGPAPGPGGQPFPPGRGFPSGRGPGI